MYARPGVYVAKAFAVLALDILFIILVQRWISAFYPISKFLALPLAFLFLHVGMVALVVSSLAGRKLREQFFRRSVARLEQTLYNLFSEHAYGSSQTPAVRAYFKKQPRVVQHLLLEFMPSAAADARDRLGQLAADLGLCAKWKRMAKSRGFLPRKAAVVALSNLPLSLSRDVLTYLLDDVEQEISVLAARALIQTGDPDVIERIFRMILDRTPLVQACITEDLRKHSTMLSQKAVPAALLGANDEKTGIILDILAAWHRSVYLEQWETLLESRSAANRTSVLTLLPYIITSQQPEGQVIQALRDEDESVRVAASGLAGQWRLSAAIPALVNLLLDSKMEVARSAAKALTLIGESGKAVLESTIINSGGASGRVALEALESLLMEG